MRRVSRIKARVIAGLRRRRVVRWAVAKLPPETRRSVGRLAGRSSGRRREAPPTTRVPAAPHERTGPEVERAPFVPDGTGSDPRVNVIGHFRGDFGVAEAARMLVTSAEAGGVRLALIERAPRRTP